MELSILPDDVHPDSHSSKNAVQEKISIVPYGSSTPILKEKSRLQQNMISLLIEGEKRINVDGEVIQTNPEVVLLLGSGNYLFTQRLSSNNKVKSIMVFFDEDMMPALENNKAAVHRSIEPVSHVIFPKDEYIWQFIASLQTLLNHPASLTPGMKAVKLTELLTYLGTHHPLLYSAFQKKRSIKPEEHSIKHTVEANIASNLSVEELAFLCNMSLATFKRKFSTLYSESPAKWLQAQRLEIAARLLTQKETKPAELYLQAGYENHSSFSKAFKAHFGVSPKDYSLRKS